MITLPESVRDESFICTERQLSITEIIYGSLFNWLEIYFT